jgi:DNA processing protein
VSFLSIIIMQISTISLQSANYPKLLREIHNPPQPLYVQGELPAGPCVAVVGSRRISDYGKRVTYQLAYQLAQAGLVIVSGLALGADGVAHRAALDAGGQTIAVLGSGIDRLLPSSNRSLAEAIIKSGNAVISEYEPGTPPSKGSYPARNRIIAGLSLAVIVTEAAAHSGSLITANFALEQNRLVMAVPGNITSLLSAGPNNLIKSGALPVTDSTDVLAALDLAAVSHTPVKAASREEAKILELLAQGISATDELIAASGLTASEFANVISLMEISGKVRNLGAGSWVAR